VSERLDRAKNIAAGGKPLTEQVRAQVLDAILDGRFETRLPAEGELAKMLDVSRTTLRTALSGLERDGIVTRRRAVGTTINSHVSPAALALQRHVDFDWVLRKSGHTVEVQVAGTVGPPPGDAVDAFGLEPAAEHIVMTKSYLADGVVALWVRDIVPAVALKGAVPAAEQEPALPESLDELSRRFAGKPVDHAVAQISAAVKQDSNTALPLEDGRPFTRLLETHFHADTSAFGYSILDVDGSFLQLELFRRSGS
jgi:GntR family transcriptional regulator